MLKATNLAAFPLPGDLGLAPELLALVQPALTLSSAGVLSGPSRLNLMRLDEISEENPSTYRSALANVYATLDAHDRTDFLYLLDSGPEGVALYFGVLKRDPDADDHEAFKNLWGGLEGQLPGINLRKVPQTEAQPLLDRLDHSRFRGVVLGIPTGQDEEGQEDENFQGIERLVRTLVSRRGGESANVTRWQLAIVCQPLQRSEAVAHLNQAYALASDLALRVRSSVQASQNTSEQRGSSYNTSTADGRSDSRSDTRGKSDGASDTRSQGTSKGHSSGGSSSSSNTGSNSGTSQTKNVGTNESVSNTHGTSKTDTRSDGVNFSQTGGNSLAVTQEITDKKAQHLLEHLEKVLIPRLQKGATKGLFCTAIHLCADNRSTYRSLKQALCATYQGGEATASPLQVVDVDLPEGGAAQALRLPLVSHPLEASTALFHSLGAGAQPHSLGSLLTTDELALVAGLPRHELPGLRRRKTVAFTVALPTLRQENAIDLGEVIDSGRRQPSNRVHLDKADLDKHCFVTGVTGAGKTTTCLNLLIESGRPFLVIEPAKTEYRALHGRLSVNVDYYRPNGDAYRSLRLNPFALVHGKQKLRSHASFLRNVLAAIFPMEASMPYLVEQAILQAYEAKGWNLADDTFLLADNPFDPAARAWPTMSDMIRQLDILIPAQGMGKEFEEKYRGSLVSRLTSLTHGVLGDVLDVPQSIDFLTLLDRRVVIELEEIKDGEGKALMMALILGALSEAIRERHGRTPAFRHLTLIEEAHRLLSRPEAGDKGRAMAVEAFADMLAEVRKYGEGLIIADQIPAKLIPDVIKNTHTKIVHRLFAEDDRRAMGEAMMMRDEQRDFLPNLATGEAIVFCGGWHGPSHAAIRHDHAGTDRPALSDDEVQRQAIAQLWRERHRYHPGLASLGWLAARDDAAQVFANFTRETRTALGHLLALNPQRAAQLQSHAFPEKRFEALRRWCAGWRAEVAAEALDAGVWQRLSGGSVPHHPLTAPLLALLHDASPRPLSQIKQAPAWPWEDADWGLWQSALDALLSHLDEARTADAFRAGLSASRDLHHVLGELSNHQSF